MPIRPVPGLFSGNILTQRAASVVTNSPQKSVRTTLHATQCNSELSPRIEAALSTEALPSLS